MILTAGRELLDVHLDRAFASDTRHSRIRIGHLHTHGIGQTNAHGAKTARVDPTTRLVKTVILSGPHLMLTDVGGNKSISSGNFPELLYYALRLDQLGRVGKLHAFFAAPDVNLLPPFSQGLSVWARFSGSSLILRHQLDQNVFDVANNRHIDFDALGNR